ncbi:MAG TPA: peptide-binding protein [Spirochaetota bacterium]
MFIRFFSVLGSCILMTLAGCGFSSVREPGAIYIHLAAEPGTLNPIISIDSSETTINTYIQENLIRRDNDTLDFVPQLAEKWDISSDKLGYTFYLKKGILWHDGVELTADDIIYSYRVIMDPTTDDASLRIYYQDVDQIRKIDKYTVYFHFRKQYYRALEICGGMQIIPKHIFDSNGSINNHPWNRHPIGTGPYIFKEWKTGQSITLVRNEKYWGKIPEIRKIVFRIVPENKVAFKMMKKGELDYMVIRPIQWTRQTSGWKFNSEFNKIKYYTPNFSYIGWNNAREPFNDKRVRRAMTMLVNREKLGKKLFYDLTINVSGPFYINGPDYDQTIKPLPYDPDGAKKLLAEAGWKDSDGDGYLDRNGKPFSFVMTLSSGSPSADRIATILKEDLSHVGIKMEIERYEWAVFLEKITKKKFDATYLAWSLGFDSDPYQIWHSSSIDSSGSNNISYRNPKIDQLCDLIRLTYDVSKRREYYHEFHRIIAEDQPYTFMFCSPSLVTISKRFGNVKVHSAGLDLTEWTVEK